VKRRHFHIIILAPTMASGSSVEYPDGYVLKPGILYEKSVKDDDPWEHPYHEIAKCKALQLWHERNDGHAGNVPHLLFSGDTPFWGGVKRHGIVVACSGAQPWFDRMIAGMTADILIALAHNAYEKNREREGLDFLP
jgi:hypothetical protein